MNSIYTLLLLAATVSAICADFRVHNGTRARLGQFPWIVGIGGCTASIIDEYTILTASHCHGGHNSARLGALNKYNPESSSINVDVVREILHPRYPGGVRVDTYDIMILKTRDPIRFSAHVRPIKLYCRGKPQDGTSIISMGYGRTETGSSGQLTWAYNWLTACTYKPNYICSHPNPNAIDSGDSGGPAVLVEDGEYYQFGVNSGGGASWGQSIYASVPLSCDFIRSHMGRTQ